MCVSVKGNVHTISEVSCGRPFAQLKYQYNAPDAINKSTPALSCSSCKIS